MTAEEYHKAAAEYMRQQQEAQYILQRANQWAAERQALLDAEPRRQYAVIAALDHEGGFGKDGQIPWHFTEDMQWFKQQTDGGVLVMGKTTYLDINTRVGDKGATVLLPNRKSFVVSSTLTQADVPNATVVKSIYDVDLALGEDDVGRTIFLIGGERIFIDGLSIADRVLITSINAAYECDRFFPTHALNKLYRVNAVSKTDTTDDLRFIEFIRRGK